MSDQVWVFAYCFLGDMLVDDFICKDNINLFKEFPKRGAATGFTIV